MRAVTVQEDKAAHTGRLLFPLIFQYKLPFLYVHQQIAVVGGPAQLIMGFINKVSGAYWLEKCISRHRTGRINKIFRFRRDPVFVYFHAAFLPPDPSFFIMKIVAVFIFLRRHPHHIFKYTGKIILV